MRSASVLSCVAVAVVAFGAGLYLAPPVLRAVRPIPRPYYDVRSGIFEVTESKQAKLVMLGDSIIEQGLWSEWLPCSVLNRGIGGDTTAGVLNRVDNIIALKPKRVYLLIGVNDAMKHFDIEQSALNIGKTVSRLSGAGIEVKHIATFPTRFEAANSDIAQLNAKTDPTLSIDINPNDVGYDGIHILKSGYQKMIAAMSCD